MQNDLDRFMHFLEEALQNSYRNFSDVATPSEVLFEMLRCVQLAREQVERGNQP